MGRIGRLFDRVRTGSAAPNVDVTVSIIDAIVVVRRSHRHAVDRWIATNCRLHAVSAPIPLQSGLSVTIACDTAAVLFALLARGQGWSVEDDQAALLASDPEMFNQMRWVRSLRDQIGMQEQLRFSAWTALLCEFDRPSALSDFVAHFGAHVLNARNPHQKRLRAL